MLKASVGLGCCFIKQWMNQVQRVGNNWMLGNSTLLCRGCIGFSS